MPPANPSVCHGPLQPTEDSYEQPPEQCAYQQQEQQADVANEPAVLTTGPTLAGQV